MKLLWSVLLVCCLFDLLQFATAANSEFEDSEFAEFEDFEDEFVDDGTGGNGAHIINSQKPTTSQQFAGKADETTPPSAGGKHADFGNQDDYGIVEDDDDDFEHFQDEEMFEGFDPVEAKETPQDTKTGEPKLTIAKFPIHFRTHWDSYWMEMLMLAGLFIYFANFFTGKAKNARLAQLWLSTHKSLLDDNFVLVGDDGKLENEHPGLIKESESMYTLWCSGRTCCEGMLVELKMIKRQDVVAMIARLMRPTQDQVHIKVDLHRGLMDNFVCCVGTKKTVTRLFKEYTDLSKFCSLISKSDERYNLPTGFTVLSEIPEATSAVLDSSVLTALNKYRQYIDYIHISDQFSGPVQTEDNNNLKQAETKPVLLAGFNLPGEEDMDIMKPLLVLIFYLMERLKVYRMSREGKVKADKNRLRVEEEFLKSTHVARAEAAAQRREDKRKQEKERVMADDDPEKQRRWELKEQKRQAKKKGPKMKRLAVKSL